MEKLFVAPGVRTINGGPSPFSKPKRNVPKVNYCEPDVPGDDRYIYCDRCGTEYADACPQCGALVALRDTPVEMGAADRARRTAPRGVLQVRPSPIHGLGVFALRPLRRGLRLGPYQGTVVKVCAGRAAQVARYGWLLRGGRLVDAADETVSNWLRFVNCSRNMREQNLVAYQYRANLYYRTCRDVPAGEELLVFYGDQFAAQLGIDVKVYYSPPMAPEREMGAEEDEVHFCDYCPMGFRVLKAKQRHTSTCEGNTTLRQKHEEAQYWTCQFCKATITSEEFLNKHVRFCRKRLQLQAASSSQTGRNESTRVPDVCNKTNKKGTEKFVCHLCQSVLSSKGSLREHINFIHSKNAPRYYCHLCAYTTLRKYNLSRHQRIHDEVKAFVCPLCKKSFNQKCELAIHMDNHAGKKGKYKCTYCPYASHRKSHLAGHINDKHTRAHLYKCAHCPYTSTEKSTVKTHEMHRHTGEKPFKCRHCPYAAVQSSQLKGHIKNMHSNTKN